MRFARGSKPADFRREVTTRRLAVAQRALAKERERAGLFADDVAATQISPLERVEQADRNLTLNIQESRDQDARSWRRVRTLLQELPADLRKNLLDCFSRGGWPKTPSILHYLLEEIFKKGGHDAFLFAPKPVPLPPPQVHRYMVRLDRAVVAVASWKWGGEREDLITKATEFYQVHPGDVRTGIEGLTRIRSDSGWVYEGKPRPFGGPTLGEILAAAGPPRDITNYLGKTQLHPIHCLLTWTLRAKAQVLPATNQEQIPLFGAIQEGPTMAKIHQDVLNILGRMEIEGDVLKLTCGQLDPKEYKKVDAVLQAMGGKWNRKRGGHRFPFDPTEKLEMVLLTGEILSPQDFGYYPTPAALAEELVEMAGLEPWHLVGEPEAGQGAIAEAIAKVVPKKNIHCYELLPDNAAVLQAKGFRVLQGDFLSVTPTPIYDRLIMNPPFEKQADIAHVLHAFRFLKPGGRLTAIMSAGMTFRSDRKSLAFRAFLDENGWYESNPEGSFKTSGTGVNTIRLVLDNPLADGVAATPLLPGAALFPGATPAVAAPTTPVAVPVTVAAPPTIQTQRGGLFPWYQPATLADQEGKAA